MSEDVLALALTVAILGGLFLWVPTLDICNDRCRRLLLRRKKETGKPQRTALDINQAA